MILCIDIGNTSIKMARVSNRRVLGLRIVPASAPAAEIARTVAHAARGGILAAAVSSVKPQSTSAVVRAIQRELRIDPLVVSSRVNLPITIATRHPARVGADRICAACGALTERKRNAIIVDIGSAITVDLVLDRCFRGGLIMAGPQMALSALHHFTAQLPDLKLADVRGDAFDDTILAMKTGALVGAAGAIEAAVALLQSRASRRGIPVWLTGGHADRFQKRLPRSYKSMPGLTLIGLAAIARHNPRLAR
jgi:type III pantothenate kinase